MTTEHSLDNFEKQVNSLVDAYFNNYTEYNEITINEYFTDAFYYVENELDLDILNEAEQQVRHLVFKD